MKIKVYVAGPYTNGDKLDNTMNAVYAAELLMQLGYVPFVPHLSHYWDEQFPHDHAEWIDWCLEWVKCCDAILRLPGDSKGADIETELAAALGIPVYESIEILHQAIQENA